MGLCDRQDVGEELVSHESISGLGNIWSGGFGSLKLFEQRKASSRYLV
jgi:hypothetical protein